MLAISIFALAETLSKGMASENLKGTSVAEDNFITDEKASGKVELTGTDDKAETVGAKFDSIANSLTRPIRSYIASCYAYAADNEIKLSDADASENVEFNLVNMFPGDEETKTFRVKVKHSGTVKVHCEAMVNAASTTAAEAEAMKEAAEAIRVQVKIDQDETPIYDGEMLNMPNRAIHTLTGSGTTELKYTITAYMKTSVSGKEFMDKAIKADFKWWLEEVSDGGGGGGGSSDSGKTDDDKPDDNPDDGKDDQKDDDNPSDDKKDDGKTDDGKVDKDKDNKDTGKNQGAPKTGDNSNLFLWIGLAACTGGGTIFLIAKKRQKEDEENV